MPMTSRQSCSTRTARTWRFAPTRSDSALSPLTSRTSATCHCMSALHQVNFPHRIWCTCRTKHLRMTLFDKPPKKPSVKPWSRPSCTSMLMVPLGKSRTRARWTLSASRATRGPHLSLCRNHRRRWCRRRHLQRPLRQRQSQTTMRRHAPPRPRRV